MLGRRPRSALEGLLGLVWASALVVTAGCGDDMPTSNPGGSTGASGGAGGGGGDGGTINGGCPPGAKPDGGTCLEPGVPEGACGDGFTWEAGGCTPILPALPCPSGQIARPGETACHPLADCGRAPWGNIPVETDTVYVDASFVGTSDGSESNPYTSLEFGMNSASAGQLVAVAAGTYVEDIDIQKPVRIWGRCPDLVKVVGVVDEELSTIIIGPGADGSEIRGLSIEGPEVGLALSGAEDVLFENLWIHDTGHFGIFITRDLGDTAYTLRGMLVENAVQGGIRVFGARGVVEDTVVRDIAPLADGTDGEGITATEDDLGTPELTVRRSVVERTSDAGILLSGGELVVEDSVVRDIEPSPAEQIRGRGIAVQYSLVHEAPAVGEIRRTVVSDAHEYGIFVWSSEALVEHVTVRQVDAPSVDLLIANGIAAIHAPAAVEGAQLTLRQSLSERNGQTGVHVSGSDAVIEQVLVRDSLSLFGQRFGRGIQVQKRAETGQGSNVEVRWSTVRDCFESGILVTDSSAAIHDTLISGILAAMSDGQLGDGIDAIFVDQPTQVSVHGTRVEASARVGVALFASTLSMQDSALDCNAIDLNGEQIAGVDYEFVNLGGNECGCDGQTSCKLLSTSVGPPDVAPDP